MSNQRRTRAIRPGSRPPGRVVGSVQGGAGLEEAARRLNRLRKPFLLGPETREVWEEAAAILAALAPPKGLATVLRTFRARRSPVRRTLARLQAAYGRERDPGQREAIRRELTRQREAAERRLDLVADSGSVTAARAQRREARRRFEALADRFPMRVTLHPLTFAPHLTTGRPGGEMVALLVNHVFPNEQWRHLRQCARCATWFVDRSDNQNRRFCSPACSARWWNRAQRRAARQQRQPSKANRRRRPRR
jgi:hypothetical protein